MNSKFLADLALALAPAIEPLRAPAMRAYMRDQFEFFGIQTPQRRLACHDMLKQLKGRGAEVLLSHARQLWELPQREYQYIALDLLAMHWKEFDVQHISPLLSLVQEKSWWDSVDGLAAMIGDVLRYGHAEMDQALTSENMWVRRVVLLHQLGWRAKTDTQRLFEYALTLSHEKEFFIQKAIGWALRDYARHDPDAVRSFIQREQGRLSALSYREANKHLKIK